MSPTVTGKGGREKLQPETCRKVTLFRAADISRTLKYDHVPVLITNEPDDDDDGRGGAANMESGPKDRNQISGNLTYYPDERVKSRQKNRKIFAHS